MGVVAHRHHHDGRGDPSNIEGGEFLRVGSGEPSTSSKQSISITDLQISSPKVHLTDSHSLFIIHELPVLSK